VRTKSVSRIGIIGWICVATALIANAQSDGAAFAYDRAMPLDAQQHEISDRDGVRVSLLSFAITSAARAQCLLVEPERTGGKTGAIVWMHSSGAFNQLPDAVLMAQVGAISLLINPSGPDWNSAPETWAKGMLETVISIRRGVDLLLKRSDVDPRRLGFAGHSYGALMGVDAAAVDRRFKAAVFEVGLPGMTIHIRTAPIDFAKNIRKRLGPHLNSVLSKIEPLDAVHYVGSLTPTALLFQSARLDPGVPEEQAQAFFDAASQPKALKWYDTAHEVVDIAAISDRARFLDLQLGLRSIDPILRAKIGVH
jgi:hypothetical protein